MLLFKELNLTDTDASQTCLYHAPLLFLGSLRTVCPKPMGQLKDHTSTIVQHSIYAI